jgi:predicted lipid carrier protein YhbT
LHVGVGYFGPYDAEVQFLSDAWIDALAAVAVTATVPDLDGITLVIEHVVDDSVTWHVTVANGGVSVTKGPSAIEPDIRFRSTKRVATAIASGKRAAADAFMGGELQVGGSYENLLDHQRTLATVEDIFGPVRARTTFV